MTFYEKLCSLSEASGKTVTRVLQDCNLSTGMLSALKAGGGVQLETAQTIANYFGKPLTVFEDCEVKRNA